MNKQQKAEYDRLCYACLDWRERKLAQNKTYQSSPAGKARERARRQSPARQAYMKAYNDRTRHT